MGRGVLAVHRTASIVSDLRALSLLSSTTVSPEVSPGQSQMEKSLNVSSLACLGPTGSGQSTKLAVLLRTA